MAEVWVNTILCHEIELFQDKLKNARTTHGQYVRNCEGKRRASQG